MLRSCWGRGNPAASPCWLSAAAQLGKRQCYHPSLQPAAMQDLFPLPRHTSALPQTRCPPLHRLLRAGRGSFRSSPRTRSSVCTVYSSVDTFHLSLALSFQGRTSNGKSVAGVSQSIDRINSRRGKIGTRKKCIYSLILCSNNAVLFMLPMHP